MRICTRCGRVNMIGNDLGGPAPILCSRTLDVGTETERECNGQFGEWFHRSWWESLTATRQLELINAHLKQGASNA